MDKVIKKNHLWWTTPGSVANDAVFLAGYDRDDILEENPNSELLVELNQYVVTTDSQDNSCGDVSVAHERYLREAIGRPDLIGVKSVELQVPYIEFFTNKKNGKKVMRGLHDADLYLGMYDGKNYHFNRKLDQHIKRCGLSFVLPSTSVAFIKGYASFEIISSTRFRIELLKDLYEDMLESVSEINKVDISKDLNVFYLSYDRYCAPDFDLDCVLDAFPHLKISKYMDNPSTMQDIISQILDCFSDEEEQVHQQGQQDQQQQGEQPGREKGREKGRTGYICLDGKECVDCRWTYKSLEECIANCFDD